MDTQILEELVIIRSLVVAIVIAIVIFVIVFLIATIKKFPKALEQVNIAEFFNHGNALLMKGELEKLIEQCEKHLLNFPSDAGALWLKGTAHYRRNEWNQALICYRKTDELQPGFAIGPSINEIEEKISLSTTSANLRIVTEIKPTHDQSSTKNAPSNEVDA
jgi:tetratricopeptide (TPR) repeat protein